MAKDRTEGSIEGSEIRRQRRSLGWSQSQLGNELVGFSQSAISAWEKKALSPSARGYQEVRNWLEAMQTGKSPGSTRPRSGRRPSEKGAQRKAPNSQRRKNGGARGRRSKWLGLMRGNSRKIEDMVVAWMNAGDCDAELEAYVQWDVRATATASWELISFFRQPRDDYYRRKERAEDPDLIEYHWVLEDLETQKVTVVRKITEPPRTPRS